MVPSEFQQYAHELYTEIQRRHAAEPIEIRFRSVLRLLVEQFGLQFRQPLADLELEFWKAACAMQAEPGITKALLLLQDHQIAIGAVSNSVFGGHVIEWELERNRLLQSFQFVMSTADYGLQKPHQAIFETAAAKLALRPDEIWFVGDNIRKDVAGARDAGLTAVWYNPANAPREMEPPQVQVASWSEFRDLVRQTVATPDG